MLAARTPWTLVAACFLIVTLAGCGGGGGGGGGSPVAPTPNPIPIPTPDPGPDPQPNQPPSITSISPATTPTDPARIRRNEEQTIRVSVSDPDNDPLTYNWTASEGTIASQDNQQEALYTAPDTPGSAIVTVTITDGKSDPVSADVYFLIGESDTPLPGNSPPTVILSAYPVLVAPGGTSTITAMANDPDGDPLTYTWIVNEGRIKSSLDHQIVWVAPDQPGSYSINVSVSDNKAPAVQASVAVTVEGGEPQQPFTNGLLGRYYKNSGHPQYPVFDEADFRFERIDPNINFDWGRTTPHPDLIDPVDGEARDFNIRWTGYIRMDEPGTYNLRAVYDDGFRLYIGNDAGQLVNVIEGWYTGPDVLWGSIDVEGGKWYPIVVEYFEDEDRRYVHLYWVPPGATDPEIVPTHKLRTPG